MALPMIEIPKEAKRISRVARFRPSNCDDEVYIKGELQRCVRCGQKHLRPGFCQALVKGYDPTKNPCLKYVTDERYLPGGSEVSVTHPEVSVTNELSVTSPEDVSVTPAVAGRACENCGQVFVAKRVTARYCSDRCRKAASREDDG